MNITIVPVSISNKKLIEHVKSILFKIFRVNIGTIEVNVLPKRFFSKDRNQYFSTEILEYIIENTIGNLDNYFIVITELDLYIPALTFIFGEAQYKGRYSIISACRLHEEFYTGITDEELFKKRLLKEILHELGHNFGLIHCIDWDCVMHSSNSVEEVDIKGDFYCKSCISELKKSNPEIQINQYYT
jgi:archaemetzincin